MRSGSRNRRICQRFCRRFKHYGFGTLTTAINNLLKKGYVNRKRGEKDRRVVYISLSEKGRKAYSHHREFHKRMIQGLLDTLNEQEQDLLVKVMQYFHDYFREHM